MVVLLFSLILISSSEILFTNIEACDQSERSSLLSFAQTLSSPSPVNWTSANCCIWEGITCNHGGWISHLQLPSRGLKFKGGVFQSSSLVNLTNLIHLNLSHNSLYGSLDHTTRFFLSLSRLEVLDLSYNLLSGELPFSISFRSIRLLDLSSNHFHGAIPSSFFQQVPSLTSFNVSNNSITGTVPSSVCLASQVISVLDLSFNKFSGEISLGLGECSKLQVFRASYNNLSGSLPDDIYNATTLEEIALSHNSLSGAISERLSNLTHLSLLDLNTNGFGGALPRSIGKLSKLKLLLLHFNNIGGSMPQSLMNCTSITQLNMGFNNLEGNISALNFSRLSQLSILDLGKNHLTGIFPPSLYSCKSLKGIRLNFNDLEGELQPDILSLQFLSFLALGYNRFTNIKKAMKILMHCRNLVVLSLSSSFIGEEMPADLGMVDFDGFQNLRLLALGRCELTGQIPTWLYELKKLMILGLESNRITGSIPTWLGKLPKLYYISLDNNKLSGELPKELCRLPMLVSKLTASQGDDVYVQLPIYGYAFQGPTLVQYKLSFFPPAIYLGNNTITGNIPAEMGQLQRLHILSLTNNNLSGNIPKQLSNLKNLEILDLSVNHLSGKIPSSFTSLNFLSSCNVSYNDLEGKIPVSTQLQDCNSSAFEGNPKLCGAPLPNECQENKGSETDDDHNKGVNHDHDPWFSVSIAVGFVTGFWGVYGSLAFNKTWRFAYFRFIEHVQDNIYVMITVCINKLKRMIHSS